MPGKTRKCWYNNKYTKCPHGGSGNVDEMICIPVKSGNRTVNHYYHKDCYEMYLADKERKEKEIIEWDALVRCIADIHGLVKLEPSFMFVLQDLRNGTVRLGKRAVVRYKEGVEYELIREAYELSRKSIEKAKMTIRFNSIWSELLYGYKIMLSKLNEVVRRKKREQAQAVKMKAKENNLNNIIIFDENEDEEITYKKKPVVDVSRFFE